MKIGIHPDRRGTQSYSEKWREFLEARSVSVKEVDLNRNDTLEQIKDCDGVMWRYSIRPADKVRAYQILDVIERYLNIPVFPNYDTRWHYDEKLAQYYIFQALGIPTPKTWIFWNKASAVDWANKTEYPKVFKLSAGASSSNVRKVDSRAEALTLIDKMFDWGVFPLTSDKPPKKKFPPRNLGELKAMISRLGKGLGYGFSEDYPPLPISFWHPEKEYIYFQEFVADNAFDTRVNIIGEKAFAFRRWNRDVDFRASGSGKMDYNMSQVDLEIVRLAFKISRLLRCQSMAYDFIYDEGKPVVTEMSYTYVDWAVEKCPGHWKPDLTWVEGNMWPEEAQVEDFIGYIKRLQGGK